MQTYSKSTFRLCDDYTIGVICTTEFGLTAFRHMLDEEHPGLEIPDSDTNKYILGSLYGHNIVLTCFPGNVGKCTAAIVATHLIRTFTAIESKFLVGTGGGVPSSKHDIRLGDVVIGMPDDNNCGIIQYDLRKCDDESFQLKGFLHPPPTGLRNIVWGMISDHRGRENKIREYVSEMVQKLGGLSLYSRPTQKDLFFKADYSHVSGETTCCNCDATNTVHREDRWSPDRSRIHEGPIASADSVMKSARERDEIIKNIGKVLCFEMEAAGVATEYSFLTICGISNYADSHKNDIWRYYAAAAAAATTKEIISNLQPPEPSKTTLIALLSNLGLDISYTKLTGWSVVPVSAK
ncbi:hypothetical protein H072_2638 [Dactylellina haptotyla CBS 200.50]|uniref:Nucleoside phosphorylase domain-containing protein n=1 Tax=Dactylellina haptotyla (strain CBS 200.50) TaxID=1284197 RepID=S8AQN8_DACHA|nr:hypothetical protein H072_2638 [Dactylellina haptotyla CBS 200.50]